MLLLFTEQKHRHKLELLHQKKQTLEVLMKHQLDLKNAGVSEADINGMLETVRKLSKLVFHCLSFCDIFLHHFLKQPHTAEHFIYFVFNPLF